MSSGIPAVDVLCSVRNCLRKTDTFLGDHAFVTTKVAPGVPKVWTEPSKPGFLGTTEAFAKAFQGRDHSRPWPKDTAGPMPSDEMESSMQALALEICDVLQPTALRHLEPSRFGPDETAALSSQLAAPQHPASEPASADPSILHQLCGNNTSTTKASI